MTVEQSKIVYYDEEIDKLGVSVRIKNLFSKNLKDPSSTEESFLGFVKSFLGRDPFLENPFKAATLHDLKMINEEINSLTIQTNNKIEQINMALSQANNLINNQNEQLAAAYIKISSLEDKVESLEDKNEQLWNLVCQSKLIDCSHILDQPEL